MIRPGAADLTLIAAVLLAVAARADAQPGAPDLDADLRAAELFDLGLERKHAGDLDGACAAFAESQALVAALGTQLNLATCLERDGRLDEARALLRATRDEATRRGDRNRADRAQAELARLDARLVTVVAAPAPLPEAVVAAPAPLPEAVAVALAPRRVVVAPVARPTRLPFVLGLGAGALTAAGAVLVFSGHEQQDAADAACPVIGRPDCDAPAAQALNESAVMRSRLGVGMLVGGVVIAETVLYLWWRGRDDRREHKASRHTGLMAAPGGGVVTYAGSF